MMSHKKKYKYEDYNDQFNYIVMLYDIIKCDVG